MPEKLCCLGRWVLQNKRSDKKGESQNVVLHGGDGRRTYSILKAPHIKIHINAEKQFQRRMGDLEDEKGMENLRFEPGMQQN